MKIRVLVLGAMMPAAVNAQVMPSDAEIGAALERWQPTIQRALAAPPAPPQKIDVQPAPGVTVPNVYAPPQVLPPTPTVPQKLDRKTGTLPPHLTTPPEEPVDFDKLIRKYEAAAKPPEDFGRADLYLFASFSIPEDKLKKLLAFAAEFGATVVFRGGLDEEDISMQRIMRKVLQMRLKSRPKIQIHPPLFTRYKVEAAPAWVLAGPVPAGQEQEACAPAGSFAMVSGDVPPEFALNLISRRGEPAIAQFAAGLLRAQGKTL